MKSLRELRKFVLCLTLSLLFSGCAALTTAPTAGPGKDDQAITSKVYDAIFHDAYLRSSQIAVSTSQGVVKLTGVVEKSLQVQRATSVAEQVPGVVGVKNELTVKE